MMICEAEENVGLDNYPRFETATMSYEENNREKKGKANRQHKKRSCDFMNNYERETNA